MMRTFLLCLFNVLSNMAFSQKLQEITYKAKNEDCQKVKLTVFYVYDTLCETFDYDATSNKTKGGIFTKKLNLPESLVGYIV